MENHAPPEERRSDSPICDLRQCGWVRRNGTVCERAWNVHVVLDEKENSNKIC